VRLEMTLDCKDLEAMASFWSQALGRRVQPVVPGEYVALEPVDGGDPTLALQRVEEPKTAKNRLHLDLLVPDVDAEVARLEALGARRLTSRHGRSSVSDGSCWPTRRATSSASCARSRWRSWRRDPSPGGGATDR